MSHTFAKLRKHQIAQQHQDKLPDMLKNYLSNALKTDGNIMTEAYYEESSHNNIWLIERWEERISADQHEDSPWAKELNKVTSPQETFFLEDLDPLSKEVWRNAAETTGNAEQTTSNPLTMLLFVHARQGTEEEFKQLFHEAMPQLRSTDGIVIYQLSQFLDNKTRFVTFEKFRDDAVFQAHLKYPLIVPIIQFLQTSIQDPPFESHFHRLIKFPTPD